MHILALVLPLLAAVGGVPLSDPAPGPAPRHQMLARVASDGESYLALWVDHRSMIGGTFATRVSRDGEVLDPLGIRISDEELFLPPVVWSGSSYFITWTTHDELWLMRINRDGAIVDGPRIVMTGARPYSAVADGNHVVISYLRSNGINPEPHALFLTPDGRTAADVTLAGGRDIGPVQIAYNGSTFGAVWLDVTGAGSNIGVDGVRFTIDGTLGPVTRLVDDQSARGPSLVSDGRDFLLLTYNESGVRHAVRQVSADFATVAAPLLLPETFNGSLTVLWTGRDYVIVGDYNADVQAIRLDREGRLVAGPVTVEKSPAMTAIAVTSTATTNGRGDFFMAWTSVPPPGGSDEEGRDVFGAVVTASTLAPRSREVLARAAPRQEHPSLASSGSSLLTVWREQSGLYARRTALDGRPLDPAPLRLAAQSSDATATFNGTDFIVAWMNDDGVLSTRRIPVAGALRAEGGTQLTDVAMIPAVALATHDGTTVLAWSSGTGVHIVRLRDDATFRDPVPLTLTGVSEVLNIVIAAGGEEFLVVWDETYFSHHGGTSPIGIRAARVTAGLTSLGAFDVVDSGAPEGEPAAAWNGREWLVVWTSGNDLRGRRVARDGTLRDGPPSDAGVLIATDAVLPALAWDGGYLLVWTERPFEWRPHELRTAWLADLGAPLTAVRSLGFMEPYAGLSAFLAPLGRGTIAAVYSRLAPEAGDVPRAFLQTFEPPRRRSARH